MWHWIDLSDFFFQIFVRGSSQQVLSCNMILYWAVLDVKLELGDINEFVSVDKFRYGFICVVAGDSPKYRAGEIKKDGFYSFFPTIILVFFFIEVPLYCRDDNKCWPREILLSLEWNFYKRSPSSVLSGITSQLKTFISTCTKLSNFTIVVFRLCSALWLL